MTQQEIEHLQQMKNILDAGPKVRAFYEGIKDFRCKDCPNYGADNTDCRAQLPTVSFDGATWPKVDHQKDWCKPGYEEYHRCESLLAEEKALLEAIEKAKEAEQQAMQVPPRPMECNGVFDSCVWGDKCGGQCIGLKTFDSVEIVGET